jgi:hypothetical protein
VAHPFVSVFALVDLSAPAMNLFGQLILRLTCLGCDVCSGFGLYLGLYLFLNFRVPHLLRLGKRWDGFDVASRPIPNGSEFQLTPHFQLSIFTFHTRFGRPLYPKT